MTFISNFRSPDPTTSLLQPGVSQPTSPSGSPGSGQPAPAGPSQADPTGGVASLPDLGQFFGFDPSQGLGQPGGLGPQAPVSRQPGVAPSSKTGGTAPATGSGSIAGVSTAPDPTAAIPISSMMASLSTIMPKLSGEQLDTLITSMTTKLKDTIDKSDKDQIKTEQGEKRAQIAEKAKKYEEAAKKIEDMKEKMKSGSFFDKLKLAAMYLGAIAAIVAGIAVIIAGAALCETVVGTVACVIAGSLLIGAGCLLLTTAVDSTVQASTGTDGQPGEGMFSRGMKALAKSFGADDSMADKVGQYGGMSISIGLQLTAAVMMIAAAVILAQPEFAVADVMEIMDGINLATDLATTTVSTTADVGSSVENYEAANDQADAKKTQADAKRLESLGKLLDDFIDMAITRLKGSNDRFNAVLDSIVDGMKDQANSMSRAQFRA